MQQADHLRWHPNALLQRREHNHVLDLFLRTVLRELVLVQRKLIHEVIVALLRLLRARCSRSNVRNASTIITTECDREYDSTCVSTCRTTAGRCCIFRCRSGDQLHKSTAPVSPDVLRVVRLHVWAVTTSFAVMVAWNVKHQEGHIEN
jgi:hypothetical protein